MDQKSPKEKLLEACGVRNPEPPSRPVQDQESKRYYQALLDQAEIAAAAAQKAQDQTEQSCRRLNDYIRKELPPQLVRAFEEVSHEAVACSLRPLHDSVGQASSRIYACAEDLIRTSWNVRLMVLAVLVGIATVAFGVTMVRFTLLARHFEEAKRYELWGRDVAARMEKSSPKEQERIRRWVRGGAL
jgi:hypothetical protein